MVEDAGGGEERGEETEGAGEPEAAAGADASPVEEEREEVEEERAVERDMESSSRSNLSFSFFLMTSLMGSAGLVVAPGCVCRVGFGRLGFCKLACCCRFCCCCSCCCCCFCRSAELSFCSNSCRVSVDVFIIFSSSSFSACGRLPAFNFFDITSNICFCCAICWLRSSSFFFCKAKSFSFFCRKNKMREGKREKKGTGARASLVSGGTVGLVLHGYK